MPFYLAWTYSKFNHWNFEFYSILDLSYGPNQYFMPFILAQFFVAWYPQKLHSVTHDSKALESLATKSCKSSTHQTFGSRLVPASSASSYRGTGSSNLMRAMSFVTRAALGL